MGTGMGADLLCNTDVFCFASPFYDKELPPRLLHPRRVLEGVRRGVEHGGNKSGIPTVNGSVIFDERYLGKPLVYCGTVGMLPRMVNGKPGWQKKAQVGDLIVMAGGRIGKDGIHGATFSSEELHEGSPATAVQIGDPITQRKMYDFIMRARDLGLEGQRVLPVVVTGGDPQRRAVRVGQLLGGLDLGDAEDGNQHQRDKQPCQQGLCLFHTILLSVFCVRCVPCISSGKTGRHPLTP